MSDRNTWPLALSVRPETMNAAAFDELAEAGIFHIELSSGSIDPYYSMIDFPHRSKEITKLAAQSGVTISSIHLPFGPFAEIDPASTDPNVRKHFLRIQTELLEAASRAKIGLAIVHPSGEPYEESERKERLSCAIDTIGQLCRTAVSLGVTLCLENLPRTCLCRTSDEMRLFLDAIPELRVVFDTNHSLKEDNVHYIRTVGSRIRSLHVSDYDFVDEKHWLPGEGSNPWEEILSALEEVEYNGRFLYEVKNPSPMKVAENYRRLISTRMEETK